MRYRPFGQAGQAVSALTLSLGPRDIAQGPEAGRELIYSALEAGINSYRLETADPVLAETAFTYARQLGEALDYVGVFALELFCRDGELLANELAPRVHNSGHWTIEGSETSQFENHLRAVLGLPLGAPDAIGHACMLNWVGAMPDPAAVLAEPGGHWHDYGKAPREGRKVGHATLRADGPVELSRALERVGASLGRETQVAPVVERLGRLNAGSG